MSSTISSTEILYLAKSPSNTLKMKEDPIKKPATLVRTSSIQKIIRFNTYICSQQFYVLPALLAWLKSSQDVLHKQAEKTIFLFRSMFYNFVYKLIHPDYKALSYRNVVEAISNQLEKQRRVISNFYSVYSNDFESTFLRSSIYLAGVVLYTELFLCIYYLCSYNVPYGLWFLLACWSYINFLYYKTLWHFMFKIKASDTSCKNKMR